MQVSRLVIARKSIIQIMVRGIMLLVLPIAAEGMRYAMLISRDASLLRTYLLLSIVMMIVMYLKASLISYLL